MNLSSKGRFNSWTNRHVNPALGRCLFSFALIADTHIDRENLPSSSPFPVNALANSRTRYCIEHIKSLRHEMKGLAPEFVLHLGDLTHPIPSMPAYSTAVADFKNMFTELSVPLYLLPGNHDVGDKPIDWAPAGVVCEKYLSKWTDNFGPQYQVFQLQGVNFILINAQLINSGLEMENFQREWFEQTLNDHTGERMMLFSHYPPYLSSPDEHENYDNIAEPGRSWLLELMVKHGVEAMFAGHVHHFWYNRHQSTDCYLLPSTSFTRQDYSEMFSIAPSEQMEDGRNDISKVGYFLVLVYENGHVCHFQNTKGQILSQNEQLDKESEPTKVVSLHPRETVESAVGFDMRHPWTEMRQIAPSGALDEFRRKVVRNDYPLFALWQMGIGLMRIPIEDLESTRTVARMQALQKSNHEFVVISQGMPSARTCSNLITNQNLIKRWDLTLSLSSIEGDLATIDRVKQKVKFPIFLSKLRMKVDRVRDNEPYFHRISHGFSVADEDEIETLFSEFRFRKLFDGLVFRVSQDDNVSQTLVAIATACRQLGVLASATMFMADHNPARHRCDDEYHANRIAEGIFTAATFDNLDLFIDTFMDIDRGHSVRNGVIDRMCNPRAAMYIVRNLCGILSSVSESTDTLLGGRFDDRSGQVLSVVHDDRLFLLCLPDIHHPEFSTVKLDQNFSVTGAREAVDLILGTIRPVLLETSGDGVEISFEKAQVGPLFIQVSLASNSID